MPHPNLTTQLNLVLGEQHSSENDVWQKCWFYDPTSPTPIAYMKILYPANENVVVVCSIEVRPDQRQKGVAVRCISLVKESHPHSFIEVSGVFTEEGEKLYRSLEEQEPRQQFPQHWGNELC